MEGRTRGDVSRSGFKRGDGGGSGDEKKWIPIREMPEDGKNLVYGKIWMVKEMGCEV